jgi:hydrogenase maturation protease
MTIKPILFFGYGNPSRGDDAIGPHMIEALLRDKRFFPYHHQFDAFTDFQLQIEHTIDIHQRVQVIFIDAEAGLSKDYYYRKISAHVDSSYSTHSMSPQSLLQVYRDVYAMTEPDTFMLTVTARQFELGASLSQVSLNGIDAALEYIEQLLSGYNNRCDHP